MNTLRLPSAVVAAIALAILLLCPLSCTRSQPIVLGFIGGLRGGNIDLGTAGRNGATLAIETVNSRGGIHGRPLEMLIRDDGNDIELAKASARELMDKHVRAIVGPFSTTMTEAVLEEVGSNGPLVFTPTSTANHLHGVDDRLFRLNRTAAQNARAYAEHMFVNRGYRNVSVVQDALNYSFTESWMTSFREEWQRYGGTIGVEELYDSREQLPIAEMVDALFAVQPDAVLLVANSIDVARLAQQIRKEHEHTPLLPAEWAGTQQLIELSGRAAEGMEVFLTYDQYGTQPAFLEFSRAYRRRFEEEPSFSSINAYETVMIIAQALLQQKRGQGLADAIIENSPYEGLQQSLSIDSNGDTQRVIYPVVVRNGEFKKIEE